MSKIQILDCTLRDGGYINDFHFGEQGIKKIIAQLSSANIDIIECGFLENGNNNSEYSLYTTVEQIINVLPIHRNENTIYVAMACYGEYDLAQLTPFDGKSIDGIRVTFHYNEVDDALEYCRQIQIKGYKVFVQPVGTTSYTDEQLLLLIQKVNKLKPYAFYLVDTLGLMHQHDVLRFFYLIDHNLTESIHIGFHSHNNLQLSYSNCQCLASVETDRIISLDSSVSGMGRGAGNLNTELIANYLNTKNRRYEIEPILEIVDEYIVQIKQEHEWGYSVPYYLAAINGCHPNYASYLSSKQTLNIKSIGTILRMIEQDKRSLFDKKLAEEKYREFQAHEVDDSEGIAALKSVIDGRNVLLIAPGPSLNKYQEEVLHIAKEKHCIVMSATFIPSFIECSYVFLSNLKRYNTTFNPQKKVVNLIHTSNIEVAETNTIRINYSSLLNEEDVIMDNSTIMLLNLLTKLNPSEVFLAGMDGYKIDVSNYAEERLVLNQSRENAEAINRAMRTRIAELRKSLKLSFLTPSLYE